MKPIEPLKVELLKIKKELWKKKDKTELDLKKIEAINAQLDRRIGD